MQVHTGRREISGGGEGAGEQGREYDDKDDCYWVIKRSKISGDGCTMLNLLKTTELYIFKG